MHAALVMVMVGVGCGAAAQADGTRPVLPPLQIPPVASAADPVLRWNELALDAIRLERTPPPIAARNLAMVHAAIYDAVNTITRGYTPYLVSLQPVAGASPAAAASAAAYETLTQLYPRLRDRFDRAYVQSLAAIPEGSARKYGIDIGRFVADRVLAWRAHDDLQAPATYAPVPGLGVWQRTPPDFAEPLLPQWPALTPFAVDSLDRFRPRDPPQLTDEAYTAAYREVKELGGAESRMRTREQTEIAWFWADDGGTCTPPGHWNLIAQAIARQRGTSLSENARLFALLNITLADASILCWECKYHFGFWRPVTAIRSPDQGDNRLTEPDPYWRPLLTTPPFPSYTSGHSSFSGAAASVLTQLFGDTVRFSVASDGMPYVTRSFPSFWAAAQEAGQSRIYGGIHWQFDNTEGLAIGQALGRYVCRNFLLPVSVERVSAYSAAP